MHTFAGNDDPDSRKAVFRRLVELYAAADLAALDECIAPDYVGHTSAGDRDLEAFRQSILYFHNLYVYSRDSFEINDQLVDGDKVATRMTARVKVRATGEAVTLIGINIARIAQGKLVEEWNTWEVLHSFRELTSNQSMMRGRSAGVSSWAQSKRPMRQSSSRGNPGDFRRVCRSRRLEKTG